MLASTLLLALTQGLLGSSKTLDSRQSDETKVIAPATYDGQCFYPQPDAANFNLEKYLGRWYQVAGTAFGPTAGCK